MALRPSLAASARVTRRKSGRPAHERAITAAAENLAKRLNETSATGKQIGEPWQREVWDLYDKIPELRTACRVTGQAMSQCRLVIARVDANGEPQPLDIGTDVDPGPDADHPAVALLSKFAGGQLGQAALLDAAGGLLTTTGEGVIVGKLNPNDADPTDDFDRLQMYSTEQVKSTVKQIVVRTDESTSADRVVDEEDGYIAIRVWRPHPRFNWMADSAARSALTILREIALYDDRIYATGISRLAGAGIMFVDENVTLPVSRSDDEPAEDAGEIDPFMTLLMEVMSLAIKDRDSAAALVPILARVPDVTKAAELMTFDTPFDDKILELRDGALRRFGVSVDMPPEILSGFGALQHWTGALVSQDWVNNYLPALMSLACGSITQGWLYPALVAEGHGDIEADIIVWFDSSSVRTRENTGPEAQAAYDRGEINGDALRRALGYDGGDKPTEEEFLQQVLKTLVLKGSPLTPLFMSKLGYTFTPDELAAAQEIGAVAAVPAPTLGGVGPGAGTGEVPVEPGATQEPVPSVEPVTASVRPPSRAKAAANGSHRR